MRREQGVVYRRSIPACAGEPLGSVPLLYTTEVYPRVCGGTHEGQQPGGGIRGLSPRVRGNLARCRQPRNRRRSIPACAGEPATGSWAIYPGPVYPRVCGGTTSAPLKPKSVSGLSPRVRGNPLKLPRRLGRGRSIPACAGEPTRYLGHSVDTTVYPRVCGGTIADLLAETANNGLSPRVRGNQYMTGRPAESAGSIPACAGEPVQHCLKP